LVKPRQWSSILIFVASEFATLPDVNFDGWQKSMRDIDTLLQSGIPVRIVCCPRDIWAPQDFFLHAKSAAAEKQTLKVQWLDDVRHEFVVQPESLERVLRTY
jgi:hypothetical protein